MDYPSPFVLPKSMCFFFVFFSCSHQVAEYKISFKKNALTTFTMLVVGACLVIRSIEKHGWRERERKRGGEGSEGGKRVREERERVGK